MEAEHMNQKKSVAQEKKMSDLCTMKRTILSYEPKDTARHYRVKRT